MKGFLTSRIRTEGDKQFLEMSDTVSFCIVDNHERILLCKQFRPALKGEAYSFFGGYVDAGESNMEALYRELHEETNISKHDVKEVITICEGKYRAQGYSEEKTSIFIVCVDDLTKLNFKCNDEEEAIKFDLLKVADVEQNELTGLGSYLTLYYIKARFGILK